MATEDEATEARSLLYSEACFIPSLSNLFVYLLSKKNITKKNNTLTMTLPKFLIGDNTDFPEDIFIVHLDYPRFVINLKDDDLELLEEVDDISEAELKTELTDLVALAVEFYDREMKRYEE